MVVCALLLSIRSRHRSTCDVPPVHHDTWSLLTVSASPRSLCPPVRLLRQTRNPDYVGSQHTMRKQRTEGLSTRQHIADMLGSIKLRIREFQETVGDLRSIPLNEFEEAQDSAAPAVSRSNSQSGSRRRTSGDGGSPMDEGSGDQRWRLRQGSGWQASMSPGGAGAADDGFDHAGHPTTSPTAFQGFAVSQTGVGLTSDPRGNATTASILRRRGYLGQSGGRPLRGEPSVLRTTSMRIVITRDDPIPTVDNETVLDAGRDALGGGGATPTANPAAAAAGGGGVGTRAERELGRGVTAVMAKLRVQITVGAVGLESLGYHGPRTTHVCWGPWHDRQRDLFQKFFTPYNYLDFPQLNPKKQAMGVLDEAKVDIQFVGRTVIHVPFRARSDAAQGPLRAAATAPTCGRMSGDDLIRFLRQTYNSTGSASTADDVYRAATVPVRRSTLAVSASLPPGSAAVPPAKRRAHAFSERLNWSANRPVFAAGLAEALRQGRQEAEAEAEAAIQHRPRSSSDIGSIASPRPPVDSHKVKARGRAASSEHTSGLRRSLSFTVDEQSRPQSGTPDQSADSGTGGAADRLPEAGSDVDAMQAELDFAAFTLGQTVAARREAMLNTGPVNHAMAHGQELMHIDITTHDPINVSVSVPMIMIHPQDTPSLVVTANIPNTSVRTSQSSTAMLQADSVAVRYVMEYPRKYNGLYKATTRLSMQSPRWALMYSHVEALGDLFADFGVKQDPSWLTPHRLEELKTQAYFLPYRAIYQFDLHNLLLTLHANDFNIVDRPADPDMNTLVHLRLPRAEAQISLPYETFGEEETKIAFKVQLHHGSRRGQTSPVPCHGILSLPQHHPAYTSRLLRSQEIPMLHFHMLKLSGEYNFAWKYRASRKDRLALSIVGSDARVQLSPAVVMAMLSLNDNLFGSFPYSVTSQEYQRDGNRNLRSAHCLRNYSTQRYTHAQNRWFRRPVPSGAGASTQSLNRPPSKRRLTTGTIAGPSRAAENNASHVDALDEARGPVWEAGRGHAGRSDRRSSLPEEPTQPAKEAHTSDHAFSYTYATVTKQPRNQLEVSLEVSVSPLSVTIPTVDDLTDHSETVVAGDQPVRSSAFPPVGQGQPSTALPTGAMQRQRSSDTLQSGTSGYTDFSDLSSDGYQILPTVCEVGFGTGRPCTSHPIANEGHMLLVYTRQLSVDLHSSARYIDVAVDVTPTDLYVPTPPTAVVRSGFHSKSSQPHERQLSGGKRRETDLLFDDIPMTAGRSEGEETDQDSRFGGRPSSTTGGGAGGGGAGTATTSNEGGRLMSRPGSGATSAQRHPGMRLTHALHIAGAQYHMHGLCGSAHGHGSAGVYTYRRHHGVHVGGITGELTPPQLTVVTDEAARFVNGFSEIGKPLLPPPVGTLHLNFRRAFVSDAVGVHNPGKHKFGVFESEHLEWRKLVDNYLRVTMRSDGLDSAVRSEQMLARLPASQCDWHAIHTDVSPCYGIVAVANVAGQTFRTEVAPLDHRVGVWTSSNQYGGAYLGNLDTVRRLNKRRRITFNPRAPRQIDISDARQPDSDGEEEDAWDTAGGHSVRIPVHFPGRPIELALYEVRRVAEVKWCPVTRPPTRSSQRQHPGMQNLGRPRSDSTGGDPGGYFIVRERDVPVLVAEGLLPTSVQPSERAAVTPSVLQLNKAVASMHSAVFGGQGTSAAAGLPADAPAHGTHRRHSSSTDHPVVKSVAVGPHSSIDQELLDFVNPMHNTPTSSTFAGAVVGGEASQVHGEGSERHVAQASTPVDVPPAASDAAVRKATEHLLYTNGESVEDVHMRSLGVDSPTFVQAAATLTVGVRFEHVSTATRLMSTAIRHLDATGAANRAAHAQPASAGRSELPGNHLEQERSPTPTGGQSGSDASPGRSAAGAPSPSNGADKRSETSDTETVPSPGPAPYINPAWSTGSSFPDWGGVQDRGSGASTVSNAAYPHAVALPHRYDWNRILRNVLDQVAGSTEASGAVIYPEQVLDAAAARFIESPILPRRLTPLDLLEESEQQTVSRYILHDVRLAVQPVDLVLWSTRGQEMVHMQLPQGLKLRSSSAFSAYSQGSTVISIPRVFCKLLAVAGRMEDVIHSVWTKNTAFAQSHYIKRKQRARARAGPGGGAQSSEAQGHDVPSTVGQSSSKPSHASNMSVTSDATAWRSVSIADKEFLGLLRSRTLVSTALASVSVVAEVASIDTGMRLAFHSHQGRRCMTKALHQRRLLMIMDRNRAAQAPGTAVLPTPLAEVMSIIADIDNTLAALIIDRQNVSTTVTALASIARRMQLLRRGAQRVMRQSSVDSKAAQATSSPTRGQPSPPVQSEGKLGTMRRRVPPRPVSGASSAVKLQPGPEQRGDALPSMRRGVDSRRGQQTSGTTTPASTPAQPSSPLGGSSSGKDGSSSGKDIQHDVLLPVDGSDAKSSELDEYGSGDSDSSLGSSSLAEFHDVADEPDDPAIGAGSFAVFSTPAPPELLDSTQWGTSSSDSSDPDAFDTSIFYSQRGVTVDDPTDPRSLLGRPVVPPPAHNAPKVPLSSSTPGGDRSEARPPASKLQTPTSHRSQKSSPEGQTQTDSLPAPTSEPNGVEWAAHANEISALSVPLAVEHTPWAAETLQHVPLHLLMFTDPHSLAGRGQQQEHHLAPRRVLPASGRHRPGSAGGFSRPAFVQVARGHALLGDGIETASETVCAHSAAADGVSAQGQAQSQGDSSAARLEPTVAAFCRNDGLHWLALLLGCDPMELPPKLPTRSSNATDMHDHTSDSDDDDVDEDAEAVSEALGGKYPQLRRLALAVLTGSYQFASTAWQRQSSRLAAEWTNFTAQASSRHTPMFDMISAAPTTYHSGSSTPMEQNAGESGANTPSQAKPGSAHNRSRLNLARAAKSHAEGGSTQTIDASTQLLFTTSVDIQCTTASLELLAVIVDELEPKSPNIHKLVDRMAAATASTQAADWSVFHRPSAQEPIMAASVDSLPVSDATLLAPRDANAAWRHPRQLASLLYFAASQRVANSTVLAPSTARFRLESTRIASRLLDHCSNGWSSKYSILGKRHEPLLSTVRPATPNTGPPVAADHGDDGSEDGRNAVNPGRQSFFRAQPESAAEDVTGEHEVSRLMGIMMPQLRLHLLHTSRELNPVSISLRSQTSGTQPRDLRSTASGNDQTTQRTRSRGGMQSQAATDADSVASTSNQHGRTPLDLRSLSKQEVLAGSSIAFGTYITVKDVVCTMRSSGRSQADAGGTGILAMTKPRADAEVPYYKLDKHKDAMGGPQGGQTQATLTGRRGLACGAENVTSLVSKRVSMAMLLHTPAACPTMPLVSTDTDLPWDIALNPVGLSTFDAWLHLNCGYIGGLAAIPQQPIPGVRRKHISHGAAARKAGPSFASTTLSGLSYPTGTGSQESRGTLLHGLYTASDLRPRGGHSAQRALQQSNSGMSHLSSAQGLASGMHLHDSRGMFASDEGVGPGGINKGLFHSTGGSSSFSRPDSAASVDDVSQSSSDAPVFRSQEGVRPTAAGMGGAEYADASTAVETTADLSSTGANQSGAGATSPLEHHVMSRVWRDACSITDAHATMWSTVPAVSPKWIEQLSVLPVEQSPQTPCLELGVPQPTLFAATVAHIHLRFQETVRLDSALTFPRHRGTDPTSPSRPTADSTTNKPTRVSQSAGNPNPATPVAGTNTYVPCSERRLVLDVAAVRAAATPVVATAAISSIVAWEESGMFLASAISGIQSRRERVERVVGCMLSSLTDKFTSSAGLVAATVLQDAPVRLPDASVSKLHEVMHDVRVKGESMFAASTATSHDVTLRDCVDVHLIPARLGMDGALHTPAAMPLGQGGHGVKHSHSSNGLYSGLLSQTVAQVDGRVVAADSSNVQSLFADTVEDRHASFNYSLLQPDLGAAFRSISLPRDLMWSLADADSWQSVSSSPLLCDKMLASLVAQAEQGTANTVPMAKRKSEVRSTPSIDAIAARRDIKSDLFQYRTFKPDQRGLRTGVSAAGTFQYRRGLAELEAAGWRFDPYMWEIVTLLHPTNMTGMCAQTWVKAQLQPAAPHPVDKDGPSELWHNNATIAWSSPVTQPALPHPRAARGVMQAMLSSLTNAEWTDLVAAVESAASLPTFLSSGAQFDVLAPKVEKPSPAGSLGASQWRQWMQASILAPAHRCRVTKPGRSRSLSLMRVHGRPMLAQVPYPLPSVRNWTGAGLPHLGSASALVEAWSASQSYVEMLASIGQVSVALLDSSFSTTNDVSTQATVQPSTSPALCPELGQVILERMTAHVILENRQYPAVALDHRPRGMDSEPAEAAQQPSGAPLQGIREVPGTLIAKHDAQAHHKPVQLDVEGRPPTLAETAKSISLQLGRCDVAATPAILRVLTMYQVSFGAWDRLAEAQAQTEALEQRSMLEYLQVIENGQGVNANNFKSPPGIDNARLTASRSAEKPGTAVGPRTPGGLAEKASSAMFRSFQGFKPAPAAPRDSKHISSALELPMVRAVSEGSNSPLPDGATTPIRPPRHKLRTPRPDSAAGRLFASDEVEGRQTGSATGANPTPAQEARSARVLSASTVGGGAGGGETIPWEAYMMALPLRRTLDRMLFEAGFRKNMNSHKRLRQGLFAIGYSSSQGKPSLYDGGRAAADGTGVLLRGTEGGGTGGRSSITSPLDLPVRHRRSRTVHGSITRSLHRMGSEATLPQPVAIHATSKRGSASSATSGPAFPPARGTVHSADVAGTAASSGRGRAESWDDLDADRHGQKEGISREPSLWDLGRSGRRITGPSEALQDLYVDPADLPPVELDGRLSWRAYQPTLDTLWAPFVLTIAEELQISVGVKDTTVTALSPHHSAAMLQTSNLSASCLLSGGPPAVALGFESADEGYKALFDSRGCRRRDVYPHIRTHLWGPSVKLPPSEAFYIHVQTAKPGPGDAGGASHRGSFSVPTHAAVTRSQSSRDHISSNSNQPRQRRGTIRQGNSAKVSASAAVPHASELATHRSKAGVRVSPALHASLTLSTYTIQQLNARLGGVALTFVPVRTVLRPPSVPSDTSSDPVVESCEQPAAAPSSMSSHGATSSARNDSAAAGVEFRGSAESATSVRSNTVVNDADPDVHIQQASARQLRQALQIPARLEHPMTSWGWTALLYKPDSLPKYPVMRQVQETASPEDGLGGRSGTILDVFDERLFHFRMQDLGASVIIQHSSPDAFTDMLTAPSTHTKSRSAGDADSRVSTPAVQAPGLQQDHPVLEAASDQRVVVSLGESALLVPLYNMDLDEAESFGNAWLAAYTSSSSSALRLRPMLLFVDEAAPTPPDAAAAPTATQAPSVTPGKRTSPGGQSPFSGARHPLSVPAMSGLSPAGRVRFFETETTSASGVPLPVPSPLQRTMSRQDLVAVASADGAVPMKRTLKLQAHLKHTSLVVMPLFGTFLSYNLEDLTTAITQRGPHSTDVHARLSSHRFSISTDKIGADVGSGELNASTPSDPDSARHARHRNRRSSLGADPAHFPAHANLRVHANQASRPLRGRRSVHASLFQDQRPMLIACGVPAPVDTMDLPELSGSMLARVETTAEAIRSTLAAGDLAITTAGSTSETSGQSTEDGSDTESRHISGALKRPSSAPNVGNKCKSPHGAGGGLSIDVPQLHIPSLDAHAQAEEGNSEQPAIVMVQRLSEATEVHSYRGNVLVGPMRKAITPEIFQRLMMLQSKLESEVTAVTRLVSNLLETRRQARQEQMKVRAARDAARRRELRRRKRGMGAMLRAARDRRHRRIRSRSEAQSAGASRRSGNSTKRSQSQSGGGSSRLALHAIVEDNRAPAAADKGKTAASTDRRPDSRPRSRSKRAKPAGSPKMPRPTPMATPALGSPMARNANKGKGLTTSGKSSEDSEAQGLAVAPGGPAAQAPRFGRRRHDPGAWDALMSSWRVEGDDDFDTDSPIAQRAVLPSRRVYVYHRIDVHQQGVAVALQGRWEGDIGGADLHLDTGAFHFRLESQGGTFTEQLSAKAQFSGFELYLAAPSVRPERQRRPSDGEAKRPDTRKHFRRERRGSNPSTTRPSVGRSGSSRRPPASRSMRSAKLHEPGSPEEQDLTLLQLVLPMPPSAAFGWQGAADTGTPGGPDTQHDTAARQEGRGQRGGSKGSQRRTAYNHHAAGSSVEAPLGGRRSRKSSRGSEEASDSGSDEETDRGLYQSGTPLPGLQIKLGAEQCSLPAFKVDMLDKTVLEQCDAYMAYSPACDAGVLFRLVTTLAVERTPVDKPKRTFGTSPRRAPASGQPEAGAVTSAVDVTITDTGIMVLPLADTALMSLWRLYERRLTAFVKQSKGTGSHVKQAWNIDEPLPAAQPSGQEALERLSPIPASAAVTATARKPVHRTSQSALPARPRRTQSAIARPSPRPDTQVPTPGAADKGGSLSDGESKKARSSGLSVAGKEGGQEIWETLDTLISGSQTTYSLRIRHTSIIAPFHTHMPSTLRDIKAAGTARSETAAGHSHGHNVVDSLRARADSSISLHRLARQPAGSFHMRDRQDSTGSGGSGRGGRMVRVEPFVSVVAATLTEIAVAARAEFSGGDDAESKQLAKVVGSVSLDRLALSCAPSINAVALLCPSWGPKLHSKLNVCTIGQFVGKVVYAKPAASLPLPGDPDLPTDPLPELTVAIQASAPDISMDATVIPLLAGMKAVWQFAYMSYPPAKHNAMGTAPGPSKSHIFPGFDDADFMSTMRSNGMDGLSPRKRATSADSLAFSRTGGSVSEHKLPSKWISPSSQAATPMQAQPFGERVELRNSGLLLWDEHDPTEHGVLINVKFELQPGTCVLRESVGASAAILGSSAGTPMASSRTRGKGGSHALHRDMGGHGFGEWGGLISSHKPKQGTERDGALPTLGDIAQFVDCSSGRVRRKAAAPVTTSRSPRRRSPGGRRRVALSALDVSKRFSWGWEDNPAFKPAYTVPAFSGLPADAASTRSGTSTFEEHGVAGGPRILFKMPLPAITASACYDTSRVAADDVGLLEDEAPHSRVEARSAVHSTPAVGPNGAVLRRESSSSRFNRGRRKVSTLSSASSLASDSLQNFSRRRRTSTSSIRMAESVAGSEALDNGGLSTNGCHISIFMGTIVVSPTAFVFVKQLLAELGNATRMNAEAVAALRPAPTAVATGAFHVLDREMGFGFDEDAPGDVDPHHHDTDYMSATGTQPDSTMAGMREHLTRLDLVFVVEVRPFEVEVVCEPIVKDVSCKFLIGNPEKPLEPLRLCLSLGGNTGMYGVAFGSPAHLLAATCTIPEVSVQVVDKQRSNTRRSQKSQAGLGKDSIMVLQLCTLQGSCTQVNVQDAQDEFFVHTSGGTLYSRAELNNKSLRRVFKFQHAWLAMVEDAVELVTEYMSAPTEERARAMDMELGLPSPEVGNDDPYGWWQEGARGKPWRGDKRTSTPRDRPAPTTSQRLQRHGSAQSVPTTSSSGRRSSVIHVTAALRKLDISLHFAVVQSRITLESDPSLTVPAIQLIHVDRSCTAGWNHTHPLLHSTLYIRPISLVSDGQVQSRLSVRDIVGQVVSDPRSLQVLRHDKRLGDEWARKAALQKVSLSLDGVHCAVAVKSGVESQTRPVGEAHVTSVKALLIEELTTNALKPSISYQSQLAVGIVRGKASSDAVVHVTDACMELLVALYTQSQEALKEVKAAMAGARRDTSAGNSVPRPGEDLVSPDRAAFVQLDGWQGFDMDITANSSEWGPAGGDPFGANDFAFGGDRGDKSARPAKVTPATAVRFSSGAALVSIDRLQLTLSGAPYSPALMIVRVDNTRVSLTQTVEAGRIVSHANLRTNRLVIDLPNRTAHRGMTAASAVQSGVHSKGRRFSRSAGISDTASVQSRDTRAGASHKERYENILTLPATTILMDGERNVTKRAEPSSPTAEAGRVGAFGAQLGRSPFHAEGRERAVSEEEDQAENPMGTQISTLDHDLSVRMHYTFRFWVSKSEQISMLPHWDRVKQIKLVVGALTKGFGVMNDRMKRAAAVYKPQPAAQSQSNKGRGRPGPLPGHGTATADASPEQDLFAVRLVPKSEYVRLRSY